MLLTNIDALYNRTPNKPNTKQIIKIHHPNNLTKISLSSTNNHINTKNIITKIKTTTITTTTNIATLLTNTNQISTTLANHDINT